VNVLVIGGTKFLGTHVVEAALARGDRVTVFHRGRSGPTPAGAEWIPGDRQADLDALDGRQWHAVIDTCGFVPRVVRASVDALRDRVEWYAFISTMSVYPDRFSGDGDETEPVVELDEPRVEEVTPETYGGLKSLCENVVTSAMSGRSLVIRPGLIVGPRDPSDRFTYWPHRFALGGDIVVPGPPEAEVSFIDVRDLGEFIVGALHAKLTGVFNASGTYGAVQMADVVNTCREVAGSGDAIWLSEAFLLQHGVTPWTELPLWIPAGESDIVKASSARAVASGLTYRPLRETVQATLEWTTQRGLERELRAGLTRQREAELLREWRATEKAASSPS